MNESTANTLNTSNGDSCHHLENYKDSDPNNNAKDIRILSKWKQEFLCNLLHHEMVRIEDSMRHVKLTISDKEKKIRSGLDVAYNEQSIRRGKEILDIYEENMKDLRRTYNAIIGYNYFSKDDYNL